MSVKNGFLKVNQIQRSESQKRTVLPNTSIQPMLPYTRHGTFTYWVQCCLYGDKNNFVILITVIVVIFTINALSVVPCHFCELVCTCYLCSVIFFLFLCGCTFVLFSCKSSLVFIFQGNVGVPGVILHS